MRRKYSAQKYYFNKEIKKMYEKYNKSSQNLTQFRNTMKINAINNYLFSKQIQNDKLNNTFVNKSTSIQKVLNKNSKLNFNKFFSEKKGSIFSKKNIKETIKNELYRKSNNFLPENEIFKYNFFKQMSKEQKKYFTKFLYSKKLRYKDIDIEIKYDDNKLYGLKNYEYKILDKKNNKYLKESFRYKTNEENNGIDEYKYILDDDNYNDDIFQEDSTFSQINDFITPKNEKKYDRNHLIFGLQKKDSNFKNRVRKSKDEILQ